MDRRMDATDALPGRGGTWCPAGRPTPRLQPHLPSWTRTAVTVKLLPGMEAPRRGFCRGRL